jgi:hypothetical protein
LVFGPSAGRFGEVSLYSRFLLIQYPYCQGNNIGLTEYWIKHTTNISAFQTKKIKYLNSNTMKWANMSANLLNLNSSILWPKSDFQKKKISPIMNEGLANSF